MNQLILSLLLLACAGQVAAETVLPLRGANPINQLSEAPKTYITEKKSPLTTRQYVQQPPTIPHSIEGYSITTKFNQCQTCHSWGNYQRTGATKISLTHFTTRDGIEQADVAARRYVCTACHVPQSNAKPLVENTFQPIELLK